MTPLNTTTYIADLYVWQLLYARAGRHGTKCEYLDLSDAKLGMYELAYLCSVMANHNLCAYIDVTVELGDWIGVHLIDSFSNVERVWHSSTLFWIWFNFQ